MSPIPGIYRHYKGKEYEVIGVARHAKTLEMFVVYKALYTTEEFGDRPLFVRPLEMFVSNVEVEGKEMKRFVYVRGV